MLQATMPKNAAAIQRKILAWYDKEARILPWRTLGRTGNPYHVWVSEIMLQQTTVPAVLKYFPRFMTRFPDLAALARADIDDVLTLWQGLGYYARARNLHKTAQTLLRDHGGEFPRTREGLRSLPGIGEYTSGAIASIAFDLPESAVDANVERVVARLFAVTEPLPGSKKKILQHAANLTPQKRAGDYLQAMMDLGATVCVIEKPRCAVCPLRAHCLAFERGIAEQLPRKIKNKNKPLRHGAAFIVLNGKGQILLRKRAGRSMLGDMIEVPSTDWDKKTAERKTTPPLPPGARWKKLSGEVRHSFTHFDLYLDLYAARSERKIFKDGFWQDQSRLTEVALPTLFKKAIRMGLKGS